MNTKSFKSENKFLAYTIQAVIMYLMCFCFFLFIRILPFWYLQIDGSVHKNSYSTTIYMIDETVYRHLPSRLSKKIKKGDKLYKEEKSFTVSINGSNYIFPEVDSYIYTFIGGSIALLIFFFREEGILSN